MKHWKTTLSGTVAALSLLFTNVMIYRDLIGLPKRIGPARLMLALAIVAVVGMLFHAWHASDKPPNNDKP